MEALDFQDTLYDTFCADAMLCGLLNATDDSSRDLKIRRSFQDPTTVDESSLDFFDFAYVDGRDTGNYLTNREYLEFNIYASSRANAKEIKKSIIRIIKANFDEELQKSKEGQVPSVQNVYCYRLIYKLLVDS